MGLHLNKTELATYLGCDLKTIGANLRKGMPFVEEGRHGKPWVFDSAVVVEWMTYRAVQNARGTQNADEEELKRRKLQADTIVAETNASRATGESVLVEDVVKIFTAHCVNLKQSLRGIPKRVAPLLVGERSEATIRSVLIEEIDDTLEHLSSEYIDWPDDVEGEVEQIENSFTAAT